MFKMFKMFSMFEDTLIKKENKDNKISSHKIVSKTIIIEPKQRNKKYDGWGYWCETVPVDKIFSLIIYPLLKDFNIYVDKEVCVKVVDNDDKSMKIQFSGYKNYVDEFLNNLFCNEEMLEYAVWREYNLWNIM